MINHAKDLFRPCCLSPFGSCYIPSRCIHNCRMIVGSHRDCRWRYCRPYIWKWIRNRNIRLWDTRGKERFFESFTKFIITMKLVPYNWHLQCCTDIEIYLRYCVPFIHARFIHGCFQSRLPRLINLLSASSPPILLTCFINQFISTNIYAIRVADCYSAIYFCRVLVTVAAMPFVIAKWLQTSSGINPPSWFVYLALSPRGIVTRYSFHT